MRLETAEHCQKTAEAIAEIVKTLQSYFEKTYNSKNSPETWKTKRTKISYGDCINEVKKLIKKTKDKKFATYMKDWIDNTNDWFLLETKPSWEYIASSLNNLYRQAFNQAFAMKMSGKSIDELMALQGNSQKEVDAKRPAQKIANKFISSLNPYIEQTDPHDFKNIVCDFIDWNKFANGPGISEEQVKIFRAFLEQGLLNFLPDTPEYNMWMGFANMFEKMYETMTNGKLDPNKFNCWQPVKELFGGITDEMVDTFFKKDK